MQSLPLSRQIHSSGPGIGLSSQIPSSLGQHGLFPAWRLALEIHRHLVLATVAPSRMLDLEGEQQLSRLGSVKALADGGLLTLVLTAKTSKAFKGVPKALAAYIWRKQNDPLVTATIHNYIHSLFYSLPDEILLMIFKHLQDDTLAKFCLRRVCTLFRRIILGSTPCRRAASTQMPLWRHPGCGQCFENLEQEYRTLETGQKSILRARLRKDTLCAKCLARCEYSNPLNKPIWRGCKFSSWPQELLYCSGCSCCHPSRAFSAAEAMKPWDERICIGREGKLRICQHRYITWADIETHVTKSLANNASEDMTIHCDHPSHKPRPGAQVPEHTVCGPRLFLSMHGVERGSWYLMLSIVHKLHALLEPGTGGRFRADHVRSVLSQHLETAGHTFVFNAWADPQSLMELRCFGGTHCTCVSYGAESGNPHLEVAEAERRGETDCDSGYKACLGTNPGSHYKSSHRSCRGGLFNEWCEVDICSTQLPSQNGGKQCIAAEYDRRIGCSGLMAVEADKLRPGHAWFHALDPDSYALSDEADKHGNLLPKCRDPSCRNYYRLYQTLGCPWKHKTLHHKFKAP